MAVITNPIPAREPVVSDGRVMRPPWLAYFTRVQRDVDHATLSILPLFRQSNIGAAVAYTALPIAPVAAGWYRVSVSVRVTTAAGVSSSANVLIRFPIGGVLHVISGAANVGNAVVNPLSQTHFIEVDDQATIEYSVLYASNAAGVARFAIAILVERQPA